MSKTKSVPMRSEALFELTWRHGTEKHAVQLPLEAALSLFVALEASSVHYSAELKRSTWRTFSTEDSDSPEQNE